LRYPLRNGDTWTSSPRTRRSRQGLAEVRVTSSAQNKIRHHLRNEQRERSRRLGATS